MCDYCGNGKPLFDEEYGTVLRVEIDNDFIVISCEYDENCTVEKNFQVEFCPKCGRHLDGLRHYRRPTFPDGENQS